MDKILIDKKTAESISLDDLFSKLNVDVRKGLATNEAKDRLQEYGRNEISEKHESLFIKILRKFWGPIPLMIEIAAILSACIEHWDDFIIILFLLLINVAIEFVQEFKAGNAIAALKRHLASKSRVFRDGKWEEVDAADLVPGDIIRVKLGDVLPADIKLIEESYLSVDEAALTGESLPVTKHCGDVAFSGAIIKQGESTAIVYGTGENTFFGRTAKLVSEAKTESHFQKAVVKIGDYLITLNFALVSIVVIVGIFRHQSIWSLVQFALVLTVASIPAAMPAVLSVTMAIGALVLSKKKAILSKLIAIEEMAGMDILCSDKTGTITQNKLTVREFKPIGSFTEDDILLYAALSSKEEDKDPIDTAIFDSFSKNQDLASQKEKFELSNYVPFDPVAKRTEIEVKIKSKSFKASKGAPQVILDLAWNKDKIAAEVTKLIDEAGERGFRTLGVAKTINGKWNFLGLISLQDHPGKIQPQPFKKQNGWGLRLK